MERRKAREAVMELLFEKEFNLDLTAEETYRLAEEARELENDKYLTETYFGVLDNLAEIDDVISQHAIGWKTKRMSKVSLSVMRIAVYEMMKTDVPFSVSINEAVELSKKFDDDKAPAFVNGVLNAVAEQLGLKK
jgi:N utilization substance protein B